MAKPPAPKKVVESLVHDDAKRVNIPTAEYQSLAGKSADAVRVAYERRNRDLDPQLVWRGKDQQDWSDLVVTAPPLYIQEKVHPKALVDDLLRHTREQEHNAGELMADLFADFDGIPKGADKTEFYAHDQNWSNRMILGDSLQVMASLAEREGLRGKVQCIYFDPPYGIKFNSNFQWSTTSRDVKDGNAGHITREPEQVKAFRDTWRDGIHSYLTYLRDRLTVARDLLTDSGSIFVQIGNENVHRVRAVLEEVFGESNFIAELVVQTTTSSSSQYIDSINDYVLWYGRNSEQTKYRAILRSKIDGVTFPAMYSNVQFPNGERRRLSLEERTSPDFAQALGRIFRIDQLTSQTQASTTNYVLEFQGQKFSPGKRQWATPIRGMRRLIAADRVEVSGTSPTYVRFIEDYPVSPIGNLWTDTSTGGFTDPKLYVVQTGSKVIQRCLLMATDPGDLVLDPTCGSGTTATVAEQWGRRWITIDTSRVALALARARIMGARYPFYLLADSREGQLKEAEITRTAPSSQPVRGSIRHGFVYERVPHITLKSIANNAEIDVIWEQWQAKLEPLRTQLNAELNKTWQEWEIPREADAQWSDAAKALHADWWRARITRQQEIDKSIAAKAEFEYLYDRPYEDKKKVRVAGPFTVESISPHRMLGVDEHGETIDPVAKVVDDRMGYTVAGRDFPSIILENLKAAGVQQADKQSRLSFTSLTPWPGRMVCAEGRYLEGTVERRAAVFIGPEFGTVSRPDLVSAAREAAEAGFDVLVACAFNFEAHTTEFGKLGAVPVLKARMNADLHMADEFRKTDKANLFVVFGEPDIEVIPADRGRIQVKVKGVDVFDPNTGEVRSSGPGDIACWFVDTDYNEESFFVRQAYFLGANDPYKALRTTLKAEINADAWDTLNRDVSRPFDKPVRGRIAVKVINYLGDEVMKVFRV